MFALCSVLASACCDNGDLVDNINGFAINEQCCEEFGYLPNHGMICGASEMPWCVGCDGKPVLCMTHGCAVINALDCCLSDEGETIACDPEK